MRPISLKLYHKIEFGMQFTTLFFDIIIISEVIPLFLLRKRANFGIEF